MPIAAIPFGLLALLVVVVAWRGRQPDALNAASAFFLNWVWFIAAYTPFAPDLAFTHAGIPVSYQHMWMIGDAFLAGYILALFWDSWRGRAIWAMLAASVVAHGVFSGGEHYARFLDAMFLGQAVCLISLGGGRDGNIRHLLHRIWRWLLGRRSASAGKGAT